MKNRICFLIHSLEPGGAERTVSYLANYGAQNGYDVTVIIYGKRGFYPLDQKVRLISLKVSSCKIPIIGKILRIFDRKKQIKQIVEKYNFSSIVALLYPSLIYCLPFRNKIRIISSERSSPTYLKNPIKRIIKKILFKKSSSTIFQTNDAKECYKSLKLKSTYVIQNAVGNDFAYNPNLPYVNKRRKSFVSVGSLKKEKDYPTLLRAFALFSNKYPDYKLEIYGNGPLREKLINLTKKLNIAEKIMFIEAVPNVLEKIYDAECYVQTSISEGMPNSLLEAMSIGLPCISTDCDFGPSELITDGFNGRLVPVKDFKAIAQAMIEIVESTELNHRFSINAREKIYTNSVENIGKQYYDCFRG